MLYLMNLDTYRKVYMPDFSPFFIKSKGQPIDYQGKTLVLADKFPVKNGEVLIASIEKTNASKRQGFSIDITGYCEMNGKVCKKGKGVMMLFWENTMPKQVEIKIFTKQDFVWVQNIWEDESIFLLSTPTGEPLEQKSKLVNYRVNGAAMIVEEIENGRRYRCNDGDPDEDFDDIIFTVVRKA